MLSGTRRITVTKRVLLHEPTCTCVLVHVHEIDFVRCDYVQVHVHLKQMKSTKMQLHCMHAITACTDDASIAGLSPCTQLGYSLVSCPALACMLYGLCTYVCAHDIASYTHALMRDHYYTSCTDVKRRVYETLQHE